MGFGYNSGIFLYFLIPFLCLAAALPLLVPGKRNETVPPFFSKRSNLYTWPVSFFWARQQNNAKRYPWIHHNCTWDTSNPGLHYCQVSKVQTSLLCINQPRSSLMWTLSEGHCGWRWWDVSALVWQIMRADADTLDYLDYLLARAQIMGVGLALGMFLDVCYVRSTYCTTPADTKVLYCLYPACREWKEKLEGEKNVRT